MGDECYTPAEWLRCARDVLGSIDLDPASNVAAQRVVRARRFFTIKDDGLGQSWSGRVWMNPPYSRPGPWVSKLLASYDDGAVVSAVALLNARMGSAWFRKLSAQAWRCEKDKRIKFWGPDTVGGTGRMDSCFFYLGPDPERFAAVFAQFGRIVPPSVTRAVTAAGGACVVCGRSTAGRRADADTCSSACKQRRYRRQRALAAGVEVGK